MINLNVSKKYRKDIDGIRAIAVISVIFFHFGIFPNGFKIRDEISNLSERVGHLLWRVAATLTIFQNKIYDVEFYGVIARL